MASTELTGTGYLKRKETRFRDSSVWKTAGT
jgi:hypothetical protein